MADGDFIILTRIPSDYQLGSFLFVNADVWFFQYSDSS